MGRSGIINKKRILVIGDIMLDKYYEGTVSRISPEAPVPVFKKMGERSVPGGAANVAVNLSAAGQSVVVLSVCGNDENGSCLADHLTNNGVDISLIKRTSESTITKTRLIANHNQQLLRMDEEEVKEISPQTENDLIRGLQDCGESFNVVILADYRKGLLTDSFTRMVIDESCKSGIKVIVDAKDPKPGKYRGSFLLKPNRKELGDLTGLNVDTEEHVVFAARKLIKETNCEYVLVTCGAEGMILVSDNTYEKIASEAKEVYDVSGAGDTVIAYLAACIANGWNVTDAIKLANKAAGIQVGKMGTATVSLSEVFPDGDRKGTVVFTNGCFDILHAGHVQYLKAARELGDKLIVGLNSDESVRRIKGEGRPVNSQEDRAEILRSLSFVDRVEIFDEDTPLELIKKVKPDILVKGGDYSADEVVGKDEVEANGGKVVILPFLEGKSTTSVIDKIRSMKRED